MAFFIKVHPTTIETRRGYGIVDGNLDYGYASHHDILEYVRDVTPFTGTKLPMTLDIMSMPLPLKDGRTTTMRVLPGNPSKTGDYRGKRAAHRCYVICPDCGHSVPVGRTHQHKCKEQADG